MNKKGLSIGINMIVIISVALIVLLVVVGYFFGGFETTGEGMTSVGEGAEAKVSEQDPEEKMEGVRKMWKKVIARWECKDNIGTWEWVRTPGSENIGFKTRWPDLPRPSSCPAATYDFECPSGNICRDTQHGDYDCICRVK